MAVRRDDVSASRELTVGLIGEHVSQTRFPAALEILCAEAGLSLTFELIDAANIVPFDFRGMVDEVRGWDWRGLSVTHPFKISAAAYSGRGLDVEAKRLGAANLLIFESDRVIGRNTDYAGFLSAWRTAFGAATPGKVAMAGAGGVASALAPALVGLGAEEVAVWDVDPARATALAAKCGPRVHAIPIEDAQKAARRADGIVNATAIGMKEYPGAAFRATDIGGQRWAFDAIYTPVETEFLGAAEEAGLATLSGFELFKHMALKSFEAYSGVCPIAPRMLPRLDSLRPE